MISLFDVIFWSLEAIVCVYLTCQAEGLKVLWKGLYTELPCYSLSCPSSPSTLSYKSTPILHQPDLKQEFNPHNNKHPGSFIMAFYLRPDLFLCTSKPSPFGGRIMIRRSRMARRKEEKLSKLDRSSSWSSSNRMIFAVSNCISGLISCASHWIG